MEEENDLICDDDWIIIESLVSWGWIFDWPCSERAGLSSRNTLLTRRHWIPWQRANLTSLSSSHWGGLLENTLVIVFVCVQRQLPNPN